VVGENWNSQISVDLLVAEISQMRCSQCVDGSRRMQLVDVGAYSSPVA